MQVPGRSRVNHCFRALSHCESHRITSPHVKQAGAFPFSPGKSDQRNSLLHSRARSGEGKEEKMQYNGPQYGATYKYFTRRGMQLVF